MTVDNLTDRTEDDRSRPERGDGPSSEHRNLVKINLYFPADTLEEIEAEALRLNRSVSWIVRRAVELALKVIETYPDSYGRPPAPLASSDKKY